MKYYYLCAAVGKCALIGKVVAQKELLRKHHHGRRLKTRKKTLFLFDTEGTKEKERKSITHKCRQFGKDHDIEFRGRGGSGGCQGKSFRGRGERGLDQGICIRGRGVRGGGQ